MISELDNPEVSDDLLYARPLKIEAGLPLHSSYSFLK